jgi:hypothetical protein
MLTYQRAAGPAAVCLMAALGTACDIEAQIAVATGSFDRTLHTDGPVDLSVSTGSGSVRVTPGADGSVRIVGRIRAREGIASSLSAAERIKRLEAEPPIVQTGNVIRVGEIDDEEVRHHVSIDYDVVVPSATKVRSRTGSGDQRIGDVLGPVDASAGSGDVLVGPIGSEARLRTGSGRIELRGAAGPVTAAAGSGDIMMSGVSGGVQVRTGSGNIAIDGRPGRDWQVRAGSGDVLLKVPDDARFTIDASSGSGSIRTGHPVEVTGSVARRQLHGPVRGGGPVIDINTGSGSIRID